MSDIVGEPVPEALGSVQVVAADGTASDLARRWSDGPAVVVFLRHFACLACSEHVAALAPRLHELTRLGVSVVYVGNGAEHYVAGFVQRNVIDLEQVEVVTDPSLRVHQALGLHRSWASTYGPSALISLARALLKGFRQSSVDGDNYQQGGVLVVDGQGRVAFMHRDRFTGDHAPLVEVVEAALRTVVADRAVV